MDASEVPALAFVNNEHEHPAIEIRVNFGIFAGRTVTPAEIDRLSKWLLDEVENVTIISEDRHDIGKGAEASVHQVRIEVARAASPANGTDLRELEERCLE